MFRIRPQIDLPTSDAKLLGIDKTVETLSDFLQSDNLVAPLSIAIHGDWGSGKTSLLKTLETRIDNNKIKIIFFEAWKYEYANPSVSLIGQITTELADTTDAAIGVITLAADFLSRRTLNMELKDIVLQLRTSSDAIKNFSDTLKKVISNKLGNRKLVVLIDDLDRCDVENALMILTMMKLFLDLDNCICIAAVDLKRLEQAWYQKYGISKELTTEGRSYLDKIFQIRIGMPHPTTPQIEEYLENLVPGISLQLKTLIAKIGPANPRSLKRMFNLVSFRIHLLNSDIDSIVATLWTLLEEIISQKTAVDLYRIMEGLGGFVNLIMEKGHTWQEMTRSINTQSSILSGLANEQLRIFFESSYTILNNSKGEKTNFVNDFARLYQASNEFLR